MLAQHTSISGLEATKTCFGGLAIFRTLVQVADLRLQKGRCGCKLYFLSMLDKLCSNFI